MGKVITLGELMLRLSPESHERFVQAEIFHAVYGGAEANVAVSLANFGQEARFVTKLPDNEIGRAALCAVQKYGVDTSCLLRGGKRIGIYYLEKGASQRPDQVIYDRENSAFALSEESEFDWVRIFDGAEWFHITGITPALSVGSKLLSIFVMYIGRLGPLTVASLWYFSKGDRINYPEGNIAIG